MSFMYDCFPLFQELDILEIRLEELYPVVDRFVIVESTHTHSGKPKPLHYAENRHRYAQYNDKIIHVVESLPDKEGRAADRRREMSQRNAILRGLMDAPDDAVVLISDVDEIPRRGAVQLLGGGIPDGGVVAFVQRLYYYNVNTSAPDRPWPGTRAANIADVRALSPHVIRNGLGQPDAHYPTHFRINDAGWHFSYFGGVQRIREKQDAFLHQELVNPETTDEATIRERMERGEDVWGRVGELNFIHGSASDLPVAIRCDPMRWLHFFHLDWRPVFHEDWCGPYQAALIGQLAAQAPKEGAYVEIGCWEGRSSVSIAQSIAPRALHCVDHWRGNEDERSVKGVDDPSNFGIEAAQERDVKATFHSNMDRLTAGNYCAHRQDWREWVEEWGRLYKEDPIWYEHPGIAFLHLDASHDYQSVRDCLVAVQPYLVPGAILCGDDLYAAGVNRAVHELLPGVQDVGGRLWVWQKEVA